LCAGYPPVATITVLARMIPVVLIALLSAPAWLTWPFLPAPRQRVVLEMVDALARSACSPPAACSHKAVSGDIELLVGDE
jgi:hypothetical protein